MCAARLRSLWRLRVFESLLFLLFKSLSQNRAQWKVRVFLHPDRQFVDECRFLVGIVLGVVQVLATVSVRTVVLFGKLFAQFGPVVQVDVGLLAQFVFAVCERALRIRNKLRKYWSVFTWDWRLGLDFTHRWGDFRPFTIFDEYFQYFSFKFRIWEFVRRF